MQTPNDFLDGSGPAECLVDPALVLLVAVRGDGEGGGGDRRNMTETMDQHINLTSNLQALIILYKKVRVLLASVLMWLQTAYLLKK